MLGTEDAYLESGWGDVHDHLLCADIARMQDLDEAIELEDRQGHAARRKKLQRAQTKRRRHVPIDETGKRYGLMTVVRQSPKSVPYGGATWLCVCDCGRTRTVRGIALRRGDARSCSRLRHPRGAKPSRAGRTSQPSGR